MEFISEGYKDILFFTGLFALVGVALFIMFYDVAQDNNKPIQEITLRDSAEKVIILKQGDPTFVKVLTIDELLKDK
jgi:hypothetical protein